MKKQPKGEKVKLKRFPSKVNIKFISISRKVNNIKRNIIKRNNRVLPKTKAQHVTQKKTSPKKTSPKKTSTPRVIVRRIPKGIKRRPLVKAIVGPSLVIKRPKIKASVKANVAYRQKKRVK